MKSVYIQWYFIFLLCGASIIAQDLGNIHDKSTTSIGMSEGYSSTTQTIKTSLCSFKEWVIEAIDVHQNELRKVIGDQGYLIISDIGCFDGGNFFEPLKEIVVKIRELFGYDFKIKVIYSDLNPNPGGFTKQLLNTPELIGVGVETSYYKHNFYDPLPYLSNITLCTLERIGYQKFPLLFILTKLFFQLVSKQMGE